MKTISKAVLVTAALMLAACPDDSTTYSAPVCEPAPFTVADAAGAEAYCINSSNAICQRAFGDCSVELSSLSGFFANYAECSASLTADCQATNYSTTGVNAGCAALCLADIQTFACSAFLGAEPTECGAATGTVATPPGSCSATITTGTIQDTITSADPLYSSYPSKTYCISFTAGQNVTITTAAPTSGTAIDDTVIYLLSPTGTQLAVNDDYGATWYSQINYSITTSGSYKIVVRGWGGALGSYRLTVATY